MIIKRRAFLAGLASVFAAPAIVRAESLMPVRSILVPRLPFPCSVAEGDLIVVGVAGMAMGMTISDDTGNVYTVAERGPNGALVYCWAQTDFRLRSVIAKDAPNALLQAAVYAGPFADPPTDP